MINDSWIGKNIELFSIGLVTVIALLAMAVFVQDLTTEPIMFNSLVTMAAKVFDVVKQFVMV